MKHFSLLLTLLSLVFLQGFSQKDVDIKHFSEQFNFYSPQILSPQTKNYRANYPKSSTIYVLDTLAVDVNYDMGVSTPFEPYIFVKLTFDNDYYLIDELQRIYNRDSARFYDYMENIYTRDINHNVIQKVSKFANSNGDLVYSSRYNYSYDANNNLIESIYQVYNSSSQTWKNSTLDSFFYNNQNLKTLYKHYVYDSNTGDWVPSTKREYEYDAFNNKIKQQKWYYDNNNWVNSNLDSFYYQNGYLMSEVHYYWDDANSAWEFSFKRDYQYDANGNLIQKTNYNSANEITYRIKFYYNSDNLLNYDTSFITNNLVYYYSDIYSYDNLNNLTTQLKHRYDTSSGQWNNNTMTEYSYDTQRNFSDAVLPENYWNFSGINVTSLPLQFLLKVWNPDSTNWINIYRFRYIYETVVTSVGNISNSQQITLYPNPASNVVNINLPDEQQAFVTIYDAKGRVVHTTQLVTGQVSVKSLPTGTYFLVVRGKNKVYVGKFLKK